MKDATITITDTLISVDQFTYSGPPELKRIFLFGYNSNTIQIAACPGCWEAQTWLKVSDTTSWEEAMPAVRKIHFIDISGE